MLKRAPVDRLVQAVRAVAAGGTYIDPELAGALVDVFLTGVEEPAAAELSTRERDVVRQIALGYSNQAIAERLGLSVKTVETYKSRAMEKLRARSRVDLVRVAAQNGWLASDGPAG